MLGRFKPKQQDPKLTRAYQFGREMAENFGSDLERLMQIRFGPVADGYLGVLQGQLNKCLNPTDAPPLIVARVEHKVFTENLDDLRGKMTAEIQATLSDHLAIADQADSRDKFVDLIAVNVSNYCRKLLEDGLQRLIDMANALKLADDQWRTVHPELSAKFPADS